METDKTNSDNERPERSFKEQRIREITMIYYSRPDVKKALFEFSKNRECIPRYFEMFGKRPDNFQYDSDILEHMQRGATSFHCSEELWKDPLEVSTELSKKELDELRIGWDLLLDIDSPYLEYSKIYAEILIDTLKFHGIKNIGVKFSGSKGFHIIIPWKAFPKEIYNQKTKEMFPEWPRIICQYLAESIQPKLGDKILQDENLKELAIKTGKLEEDLIIRECISCHRPATKKFIITWTCPFCKDEIVTIEGMYNNRRKPKCPECRKDLFEKSRKEIYACEYCNINSQKNPELFEEKERFATEKLIDADLVLVAPRHLFRMPYSVEYNEPICIKHNNKIHIQKIGNFIDRYFKTGENLQIADISKLNYKTLSLDLNTNKSHFNKINKVIRHIINEDLYKICLESGREINITSGHSIFVLNNCKIEATKGNKIKKGDYIVGLRRLDFPKCNVSHLSLSDELIKILEEEKKFVFLFGFDTSVFKEIYKYKIPNRKKQDIYNWKLYNILPLDAYEYLIKRSVLIKNKLINSKIKFCLHGGASLGIHNILPINKDLMRLLGYYTAEGHSDSRGRIYFSFGSHEEELINDCKYIINLLGLKYRIEKPHKTAVQIVIQSKILKLIFEKLFICGKNAKEKRVPSIVWNLKNDLKLEYLNSYIKGDGHLEKRWAKIIISTVSKELKNDLCFLLSSLGINYSLNTRKVTKFNKGKNLSYVIIIQGKENILLLGFKALSVRDKSLINRFPIRELGLENNIIHSRWRYQFQKDKIIQRNLDFIKNLNPNKDILKLINGDMAYFKVIKIKKVKPKNKYVYDLSVENDENFVGGNCILLHNSLHEKTALSSIVIDKDKIKDFQITDAKPFKITIKDFYPNAKEGEARELLLQALDWKERKDKQDKTIEENRYSDKNKITGKSREPYKKIQIENPSEDIFPPCIKIILQGIKQDGRKRALFILINFFKSLGVPEKDLEKRIYEWNEKNAMPLKKGYIQSQLNWYRRNPVMMPQNCSNPIYKGLGICKPNEFCRIIKNPVNYAVKKHFGYKK